MLIKYTGTVSKEEYPITGVNCLWQPGQESEINDSERIDKLIRSDGWGKRIEAVDDAGQQDWYLMNDASYSVVTVNDNRKFAPWHSQLAGAVKANTFLTMCWSGDSTTENMAGTSQIPYVAAVTPHACRIDSAFQHVKHVNYGATGVRLRTVATDATPRPNTGGNDCRFSQLPFAHGYQFSWGLNDCRGSVAPGAGDEPDYRTTYGGAGMIAKALELQSYLRIGIERARALNPDCAIALRTPNSVGTGSALLLNSVTAQQCSDTLRLTYRGDPALGVPCLADEYPNVEVIDIQGTVFSETAYTTATGFLLNADQFHPSSNGYGGIYRAALEPFRPYDGDTYDEKSMCRGLGLIKVTLDAETIKLSDEYEAIYECSVGANSASAFSLGINSTAECAKAWGNTTSNPRGGASAPGLVPGDVVVFSSGYVMYIDSFNNTSNQGTSIQWFTSVGPNGKTFAVLSADPLLAVGTRGTIYRHKYAHSAKARYNAEALAGRDNLERLRGAYKNMYRFSVVSTANGSINIRAIAGETGAVSGLDAFTHTLTTSDILCLAGIEGASYAADEGANYGISLTGATFDQTTNAASQTSVITLAAVDFRTPSVRQGFILSNT